MTTRAWAGLAGLLALGACTAARPHPAAGPPEALVGTFEDDYGSRYTISPALWTQLPRSRYHVQAWHSARGYLIARNDAANPSEPGRWTRIDWVLLPGMAPYAWAFCLSAYDAPSAAAAESTRVAHPETPRTGCNGYPFSRMRRVE